MKLLNIEGTVDVIGAAEKRADGMVYSEMTFLTRSGGEVFVRNVSVDKDLSETLLPGLSGRFVLQKNLFSNKLVSAQIGVYS
ncbi:hypothetical protein [Ponticaulis profundi]|uniref:Uncharacterized protein n=1 Tax=Ponticaulis profundi TaxID=2665222 RepID=A0ABW1S5X2_9PROT